MVDLRECVWKVLHCGGGGGDGEVDGRTGVENGEI